MGLPEEVGGIPTDARNPGSHDRERSMSSPAAMTPFMTGMLACV